jgi:hypothetical protein
VRSEQFSISVAGSIFIQKNVLLSDGLTSDFFFHPHICSSETEAASLDRARIKRHQGEK